MRLETRGTLFVTSICIVVTNIVWGGMLVGAYQLDLNNLNLHWKDPIYLSYAADNSQTNYFLDQGYDLVFNSNFGVSFKTTKVGILGLLFGVNTDIVPLDSYYSPPIIKRTYNDIVELNYCPVRDLAVNEIFYVASSSIAYRRIIITNISNQELVVHILALFQKLPFAMMLANKLVDGFEFPISIPPDSWQKHNLDQYEGHFQAAFMSKELTTKSVYSGIWDLQLQTGSESIPISTARRGSLLVLGKRALLQPGETQTWYVMWWKGDRGEQPPNVDTLENGNLEEIFAIRHKLYSHAMGKLAAEDREQALVGFSSLLLLREQFMQAENRLPYNYYLFSREPTWGWGHAGQVFHESIGTIAYANLDAHGAIDSQRNFFAMQDNNGYIPYRIGPYLRETIDGNTSSAPLLNWENWKIYQITHDREFLKEAYYHGARFYEWWECYRDKDRDGLCEWGGNPILECLRDSHNVVFQQVLNGNRKKISALEALDLNCFLVREAEALSYMAKELGLVAAEKWRNKAETRKELINNTFWDPNTAFYYHADMATNEIRPELKRKEMIAFLTLWAHVANQRQAQLLVKQLTDPNVFWRRYGVSSIAADDPYYTPSTGACKWNGPVWPQWQYLIFEGLLDYGYVDIAKALLRKLFKAIAYWLVKSHKFWEQYNPDQITEQKSHKDYYWTGIIFEMLRAIYQKREGGVVQ